MTVVSYTWAMLREVVDDPAFVLHGNHPVRLFIGSGMPDRTVEAGHRCVRARAGASSSSPPPTGRPVLANVSGAKIGSKGRPLPGGAQVELAAYDPIDGT